MPELDDLSRAMLFTKAVSLPLQQVVLQQHPATLVDASEAALNVQGFHDDT